jgi:large subunit ribosomal protein L35
MPKLRTQKSAAKRFHVTGSGKIMRTKGGKSHLRRNKSATAKRDFDEMLLVHKVDLRRVRRQIPYGAR